MSLVLIAAAAFLAWIYLAPPWEAAFFLTATGLYTLMTVASALRHWRGQDGQWKGRTY